MSVVAQFSVPADAFELGDALEVRRGIRIRLETMIPTGETVIPYLWVPNRDGDAVERALRASPLVADVRAVNELDDETLFRVSWAPDIDGLIDAIDASKAVILHGEGQGDRWSFRARFPEHDDLSSFYRTCLDEGIPIEMREVHDPLDDATADGFGLTDDQRVALRTALEEGYFAVPRGITLVELAEMLGVSDSAVSQRIRRGLTAVLSATLRSESNGPTGGGRDD
ncbi:MAG: helix-turn-helix domain-containing protein [Haloferacaceae archaeon]